MPFKLIKEQQIIRNVQIPKELFNSINKLKGNISLNKFVIQAVKYALNNTEDKYINVKIESHKYVKVKKS